MSRTISGSATTSSFDDFFDFGDPNSSYPSPSVARSAPPPPSSSSSSSSASPFSSSMSNQLSASGFPAPSHQYDLHPQQTGSLPINTTSIWEDFPNNTASMSMSPQINPDQLMGAGFMDLDGSSDSIMPPFFFPERGSTPSSSSSFVEPSMLLGASPMMTIEDMDNSCQQQQGGGGGAATGGRGGRVPVSTPASLSSAANMPAVAPIAQAGRYYAGIHTQQAAYDQQQRMAAAAHQQQRMANAPRSVSVEQRINKILDSMKSPVTHGTSGSVNSVLPHIAKMKKEEDDMDEDERLLNSEAGKKLTSKERRQLRNKVSARAFRSRRKEYITQLEQEIANKANEAAEYQMENRRLKEENAKFSDFTKMLLSSPEFSAFLDSMHPIIEEPLPEAPQPRTKTTDSCATNTRKDRNPNLPASDGEWALAYNQPWSTNNPQVFCVDQLPLGPSYLQNLNGKAATEQVEEEDDWKMTPFAPVSDGFFPLRSEKADILDYEPSTNYEDDESYEPPENLYGVYLEEFGVAPSSSSSLTDAKKSLDELFPGTGVESLLSNLEKILSGEAKAEDLFDEAKPSSSEEGAMDLDTEEIGGEIEKGRALGEANRMLRAVDRVYKRIGLVVGS